MEPAEWQRYGWALLGFADEIARIPERVSEEMVGLIRLAWWRERIEDIYAGKPPLVHPILTVMHEWISCYQPPYESFETMISAYQEQVGRTRFESLQAYEDFAAATSGELAFLMHSMRRESDASQGRRIREIGAAYGMLRMVRAAPAALARGVRLLPDEAGEETLPSSVSALNTAMQSTVRMIRMRADELLGEKDGGDSFMRRHRLLGRALSQRIAGAKDQVMATKLQNPMYFLAIRLIFAA